MCARHIIAILSIALMLGVAACSRNGTAAPADSASAASNSAASTTTATAIAPTVLIVDASDSMLTNDAPGKRIDAAKSAASGLVDALPEGAKLAILTYGTGTGTTPAEHAKGCRDVSTLVPLGSVDRTTATAAINGLTPRGLTPIAEALTRAAALLTAPGPASIVLVSDGKDTCGRPPCPVARTLVKAHPQLQISTVGFRTDGRASSALRCIADASDGLFVAAQNSAQLEARLLATTSGDTTALINGDALDGIALGTKLIDVRKQHSDFPAGGRRDGDTTVIVWRDCGWVFGSDGALTEIRPYHGRTIDGITVGSTFAEVKRYYGNPTAQARETGDTVTYTFNADSNSDAGYRITFDGSGDSAKVTRIIVCSCGTNPQSGASGPVTEVLRPVTKTGSTTAGWMKDATHNHGYYGCDHSPVPGVVDDGLYWCSGSSGIDQGVCAKSFNGNALLCVIDPERKVLTLKTPSKALTVVPKAMSPHMPLWVTLEGGITCAYSLVRGFSVTNETAPDAKGQYSCGGIGTDVTYLWSQGDADPFRRGSTWTATYGKDGSRPLQSLTVTKVTYVGFGE